MVEQDRLRGVVTEIIAENIQSRKNGKGSLVNLCFLALRRIFYQ